MGAVTAADTHRAIDAVWRIESARLIAGLTRVVRDVGLAEELAQDALVAALEQWPDSGVPDNPGAWLMAIAKRRAIDLLRRQQRYEHKLAQIGHELQVDGDSAERDVDAALDDDDLLRLMFIACHPVLSTEARVALTLRLLGGLTTGARTAEETDWTRIAALYETLAQRAPSPVVELNRAVALSMAYGAAAGLELVDQLTAEPSLGGYHLLPTVRGDLLAKLDRLDEAGAEFERAASLTRNERERALLLDRAAACARG